MTAAAQAPSTGFVAGAAQAPAGLIITGTAQAPATLFIAGAAKAAVERLFEAPGALATGGPLPERVAALHRPAQERETGTPGPLPERAASLPTAFGTVGALRDRILAGERPALALLSRDAIERLVAAGIARPDRIHPIGRTGVALAIPAGQPAPDLATPEALRTALLATPSFAQADPTSGATAGAHMARIIDRLGIADAMRAKTRFVPFGVEAVAMVTRGEVAMAASQATEIIAQPGVALAGLLPEPLQLWTPYAIARLADTLLAEHLVALLTSDAARAAFTATGFTP